MIPGRSSKPFLIKVWGYRRVCILVIKLENIFQGGKIYWVLPWTISSSFITNTYTLKHTLKLFIRKGLLNKIKRSRAKRKLCRAADMKALLQTHKNAETAPQESLQQHRPQSQEGCPLLISWAGGGPTTSWQTDAKGEGPDQGREQDYPRKKKFLYFGYSTDN